eukprot:SAG31_NODE_562_length_14085_cov_164.582869_9_plen_454_part_00
MLFTVDHTGSVSGTNCNDDTNAETKTYSGALVNGIMNVVATFPSGAIMTYSGTVTAALTFQGICRVENAGSHAGRYPSSGTMGSIGGLVEVYAQGTPSAGQRNPAQQLPRAVSAGSAALSGLPVANAVSIVGLPERDPNTTPLSNSSAQPGLGPARVDNVQSTAEGIRQAAAVAAQQELEEEAAEADVTTIPVELQQSYYTVPDDASGWSADCQQELMAEKTKERKSLLSLWRKKKHELLAKLREEQEAEAAVQEAKIAEELAADNTANDSAAIDMDAQLDAAFADIEPAIETSDANVRRHSTTADEFAPLPYPQDGNAAAAAALVEGYEKQAAEAIAAQKAAQEQAAEKLATRRRKKADAATLRLQAAGVPSFVAAAIVSEEGSLEQAADEELLKLEAAADAKEGSLVREKLNTLKAKLASAKDQVARAALLADYAGEMQVGRKAQDCAHAS